MAWFINNKVFMSGFMMPSEVVDKQLKFVNLPALKTILYIMRNTASGINESEIANGTGLSLEEVTESLLYWENREILLSDKKEIATQKAVTEQVALNQKPSRTDVAKRGLEDPKIMLILNEAQAKFGRNLKTNEASTLVWLYEDKGIDISVLMLLLTYAKSEKRLNIGFIEKTALRWLSLGVETVLDAEGVIKTDAESKLSWSIVERVFGIEKRKPSDRELSLSHLWINEWLFSNEMLKLAYDECVNQKAKLSMPYVAKILEAWHEKGYTTPEQAVADKKTKGDGKYSFASYDLDAFEKMLNEDE